MRPTIASTNKPKFTDYATASKTTQNRSLLRGKANNHYETASKYFKADLAAEDALDVLKRMLQEQSSAPHFNALFNLEFIIGAAIFDFSGILKHYFLLEEGTYDPYWLQSTFDALCLQVFLKNVFHLQGFKHAILRGDRCNIVVVKKHTGYLSLLVQPYTPQQVIDDIVTAYNRL
jgi:hypothetical protein